MDLETEALLFSKRTSIKRTNFRTTMFWERSLKQSRDIQVYGLMAHKVWIELEGSIDALDFNEAPHSVTIPIDSSVFKHKFAFAVRRRTGHVEVIDLDMELENTKKEDSEEVPNVKKQVAIQEWCSNQEIQYRRLTREYFSGMNLRLSNIRVMMKFLESADQSREPLLEEKIDALVASCGPVSIRELVVKSGGADETIVVAHIARGILFGQFRAQIDRQKFDGSLVVDLSAS